MRYLRTLMAVVIVTLAACQPAVQPTEAVSTPSSAPTLAEPTATPTHTATPTATRKPTATKTSTPRPRPTATPTPSEIEFSPLVFLLGYELQKFPDTGLVRVDYGHIVVILATPFDPVEPEAMGILIVLPPTERGQSSEFEISQDKLDLATKNWEFFIYPASGVISELDDKTLANLVAVAIVQAYVNQLCGGEPCVLPYSEVLIVSEKGGQTTREIPFDLVNSLISALSTPIAVPVP